MSEVDKLESDLVEAMKLRDDFRVGVLRLLKSALKNQSIEVGHDLSMAEAISVLQKEAKKRTDAAKTYEDAGRADKAEEEEKEYQLIQKYLPAQLSDDELETLVEQTITAVGASTKADTGKVMAQVMGRVAGRADGGRVAGIVAKKLS